MKPKIIEKAKTRKDIDGYLLYIPGGQPILLNESANYILSLCDGEKSIEDISKSLSKEYDISQGIAKRDIYSLLEVFEKSRIIRYID
jgi:hypothetical protein